jgi:hypothetical protein
MSILSDMAHDLRHHGFEAVHMQLYHGEWVDVDRPLWRLRWHLRHLRRRWR